MISSAEKAVLQQAHRAYQRRVFEQLFQPISPAQMVGMRSEIESICRDQMAGIRQSEQVTDLEYRLFDELYSQAVQGWFVPRGFDLDQAGLAVKKHPRDVNKMIDDLAKKGLVDYARANALTASDLVLPLVERARDMAVEQWQTGDIKE